MNIITIPGGALYTNCYLVYGDDADTCVVIDPGFQPEPILEAALCRGKKIEAILLTHGTKFICNPGICFFPFKSRSIRIFCNNPFFIDIMI